MNANLRIAALGIAVVPLVDAAIQIVEHGIAIGTLRIPSILIGFTLAYYLANRRRWAFVLSTILLSVSAVIYGSAVLYIGTTSDLYPTWKLVSCSIVALICAASLISLLASVRRVVDRNNNALQAEDLDAEEAV